MLPKQYLSVRRTHSDTASTRSTYDFQRQKGVDIKMESVDEKLAAITKHVFSSIARMPFPSGDIRKIVECLSLLYRSETRPKKWKDHQKILLDPNFITDLRNLHPRDLSSSLANEFFKRTARFQYWREKTELPREAHSIMNFLIAFNDAVQFYQNIVNRLPTSPSARKLARQQSLAHSGSQEAGTSPTHGERTIVMVDEEGGSVLAYSDSETKYSSHPPPERESDSPPEMSEKRQTRGEKRASGGTSVASDKHVAKTMDNLTIDDIGEQAEISVEELEKLTNIMEPPTELVENLREQYYECMKMKGDWIGTMSTNQEYFQRDDDSEKMQGVDQISYWHILNASGRGGRIVPTFAELDDTFQEHRRRVFDVITTRDFEFSDIKHGSFFGEDHASPIKRKQPSLTEDPITLGDDPTLLREYEDHVQAQSEMKSLVESASARRQKVEEIERVGGGLHDDFEAQEMASKRGTEKRDNPYVDEYEEEGSMSIGDDDEDDERMSEREHEDDVDPRSDDDASEAPKAEEHLTRGELIEQMKMLRKMLVENGISEDEILQ
eukprot:TRINITY_DN524_c0_g1_i1.p1 TRINITY_DN524_c0_g1~~TRINITY_DN524_c0_g1_i1.p1  ORF type:complete len:552 (-),score=165.95 TRINITY_DN524_c0_g1_i1:279-1934(-)